MPTRTQGDLHVDAALTTLSIRHQNKKYIAEQLLPRVQVVKESDKYFVYGKDNLRVPQTGRANGALAQQVSQSLSPDSYSITEHALRELVTDRDLDNADTAVDPLRDATLNTTDRLWLDLEKRVASRLTDAAVLTNGVTLVGTQQWNDYGNSDPISDIEAGIASVKGNAVQEPNVLTLGWQTWRQLKNHPDVMDRIKHTTLGVLSPDLLGQLVGIAKVLIGDAVENTALEGQADVLSYVWGKHAVIAHVAEVPGLRTQSLGYLFTKRQPRLVTRYREEARKGEWVEVQDFHDDKIVSVADGYLIKNAVA